MRLQFEIGDAEAKKNPNLAMFARLHSI